MLQKTSLVDKIESCKSLNCMFFKEFLDLFPVQQGCPILNNMRAA